ncbi:TIGR02186 family protein [Cognatiyoonia sp. IB215446]|uniref:TIGR02186 family protein n=1 Tax=Cognatiyoonia sp. IB215446 TaxID=3097355 RepID=UPI002A0E7119|nr:TIGR02186 family protein [Cognatiyoonia sp. IB215446]MDX8347028.1 TIGR02186 family protein [Cognatiyoonia sp. IB215446]
MIRLFALFILLALPAKAEEIVLGLSRDQVAITATFEGSDILVFGAIKREAPIPDESDLGVIVTVMGPNEPVIVRRKDKRLGIWVNTDEVEVDAAPSFYAVATSAPMREVLKDVEDLRYGITIPRVIRSVGAVVEDSASFTRALIRIRAGEELYQVLEGAVDLEQETLFRTAISLPANLTEGEYEAHIFLTRDGKVIDEYITYIPVRKVGLERWLYNLAHDNAFLYGLMSLAIAIAAGWGASAAFSLLRR